MSAGHESRPGILLKARPLPAQLDDRLAPPWPDGLEFYLDRQDIAEDNWLSRLVAEVERHPTPEGFVYVVEGPMRSLDGSFFDLSQDSEANRETLRRTVEFGATVGARAAVIHAIAPVTSPDELDDERRIATLRRALPLLAFYRDLCQASGLIPTVENIPPVARMREGRFMHSTIGMEPADLLLLTNRVEGTQVTLDVSHAQLYLNAVNVDPAEAPPEWRRLVEHVQARAEVRHLGEYIAGLDGRLFEAHISNAAGLCGEGLAYAEGDLDLDAVVRDLSRRVRFLITETIEPEPDRAVTMREAQRRIGRALYGETQ